MRNDQLTLMCGGALLTLALTGCGGDTKPSACTGHGCESSNASLLPGGELRFEHLLLADGTHVAGIDAAFWKDQSLDAAPLLQPGCTFFKETHAFPMDTGGASPGQPYSFVVQRTYLDAGASIAVHSSHGETVQLKRNMSTYDWFGRYHGIVYNTALVDPVSTGLLGGTTAATRSTLDVVFPGSADITARSYDGVFGSDNARVSIPNRPEITHPVIPLSDEELKAHPASAVIPSTGDYNITWVPPVASDIEMVGASALYSFIAVISSTGLEAICFNDADTTKSGSMTITQSDLAKFPRDGQINFGWITHQFAQMDGRRLDVLGSACRQFNFTVQ